MLFGRRIDGFSKSKWRHFIHPRSNLSALCRTRVDVRTVWWNVKWRLVDWWRRGVRRLSVARRRCRLRSTWRKVLLTHKLVRLIFLRQNLRSNLNLTLLASARVPFRGWWAGEMRRGRCESAEVLSVQSLLEQNRVSMTSAMTTQFQKLDRCLPPGDIASRRQEVTRMHIRSEQNPGSIRSTRLDSCVEAHTKQSVTSFPARTCCNTINSMMRHKCNFNVNRIAHLTTKNPA